MTWHSYHVHYQERQDALLREAIAPMIAECREHGLMRWFFLRYWKGGPHVRLRFELADGHETSPLLGRVQRRLEAYLRDHPSVSGLRPERYVHTQGILSRLQGEGDELAEPIPDNTVQAARYEPEWSKYGGELGTPVAERLFSRSSELALEQIPEIQRAPGRRLGIGLTGMLSSLCAVAVGELEARTFLDRYCRFWSRYTTRETIATWPQRYQELRPALLRSVELSWSHSTPSAWAAAVRDAVDSVQAQRRTILPAVTALGPRATDDQRQEFLLLNYLHTHNNRLGIVPAQEAYLSYLCQRALCERSGEAENALAVSDLNSTLDSGQAWAGIK